MVSADGACDAAGPGGMPAGEGCGMYMQQQQQQPPLDPTAWGGERLQNMQPYQQQNLMSAPSHIQALHPNISGFSGGLSGPGLSAVMQGHLGALPSGYPESGWLAQGAGTGDGIICAGSHESDMTSDSCAGEALLARRRKLEESATLNRSGSKLAKVKTGKRSSKKSTTQRLEVCAHFVPLLSCSCCLDHVAVL